MKLKGKVSKGDLPEKDSLWKGEGTEINIAFTLFLHKHDVWCYSNHIANMGNELKAPDKPKPLKIKEKVYKEPRFLKDILRLCTSLRTIHL